MRLQSDFGFNIQPGKPSGGQISENEAFGVAVSVRSKIGFSERLMPVEAFRKTAKIP